MSPENEWEQLKKEVSMEDFRSFFKELAAMMNNGRKVENRTEDRGAELVKAMEGVDSFK